MDFAHKKKAYEELLGEQNLEKDMDLLKYRYPAAPALTTGIVDRKKAQSDIVWDLLDVATVEEIKANRGEKKQEKQPEPLKKETKPEAKKTLPEKKKSFRKIIQKKTPPGKL